MTDNIRAGRRRRSLCTVHTHAESLAVVDFAHFRFT